MCQVSSVSNDQKGSRQDTNQNGTNVNTYLHDLGISSCIISLNHLQRCSVLGCGAAVLYCSHLLARNTARITFQAQRVTGTFEKRTRACLLGAIALGFALACGRV